MSDLKHGQFWTYLNHKCRCDPCKAANNQASTTTRLKRYAERVEVDGRLVHPKATHGQASSYRNKGCRCQPCTTAHSVNLARRRAR